jgi:hypothetical protein
MIELNDKSYIVGIWYSSCPKTYNNWLACAIKDPENPNRYKIWSRFRYAKGDKIFDGEDEKSWTTLYTKENIQESNVIDNLNEGQLAIKEGYPEMDRIIVKGELKKLVKLSKDKEWMHMREERLQ